ncbi:MAG: hypothetical protein H6562_24685 [Lewinellaceae bacterium]|nr:hypothetical protein [Lewinellaceae bacterium]
MGTCILLRAVQCRKSPQQLPVVQAHKMQAASGSETVNYNKHGVERTPEKRP